MIALVLTTVPDKATAGRIADELLGANLAACVSILPGVESRYVWQGKKECAGEVLLLIKTTEKCWERLRDAILRLHPYECPEILRFDAAEALQAYAAWVEDSVRP